MKKSENFGEISVFIGKSRKFSGKIGQKKFLCIFLFEDHRKTIFRRNIDRKNRNFCPWLRGDLVLLNRDDMLVVVVGSSFFYSELSWDHAVAMNEIGPVLIKYARRKDTGPVFRFVLLCGNSTDGYNGHLKVFQFMHPLVLFRKKPKKQTHP